MRIAVTGEGTDRNSQVDPHFARARYFLVVELGGDFADFRNNSDLQKTRFLAGTQAAGSLISQGIDAVITMNIGPKAYATFRASGVRVFQARHGTVDENIKLFQASQLKELIGPNVEEYWTQHANPRK